MPGEIEDYIEAKMILSDLKEWEVLSVASEKKHSPKGKENDEYYQYWVLKSFPLRSLALDPVSSTSSTSIRN